MGYVGASRPFDLGPYQVASAESTMQGQTERYVNDDCHTHLVIVTGMKRVEDEGDVRFVRCLGTSACLLPCVCANGPMCACAG